MNIFDFYQSEWLFSLLSNLGVNGLNRAIADSFQWLIEVSAIITVLYLLFCWVGYVDKKRVVWHFMTRNLFFFFCVVWVMGFITYCWGMYVEGANVLSFAPQAVLQAFGMFLSQSDISLVQSDRHESAFYMVFFSISHLFAVALSLLFVIKHFGNYLRFMIKRWSATSLFGPKREDLYVFWGKCQGSILLAADIMHDQNRMEHSRVVMVHTGDDSNGESERLGIDKLVSMVTLKDEDLEQLQNSGCLVFKSYKRLSKLNLTNSNSNHGNDEPLSVLEDMLDQRSLVKIIKHKTGKRENFFKRLYKRGIELIKGKTEDIGSIRFFMLTEDYKSNVDAIKNLLRDAALREGALNVDIYCLVNPSEADVLQYSFDSITSDINLKNTRKKQIQVHVIDASMLAISQLKRDGAHHPVKYMDVDEKKVCATSSFNGMILGFGDTGREALSYMYEFSAIPDCNGTKMKSEIIVIDKAMDEKRGAFYEQRPAFYGDESEIRLVQADIQSEKFLTELSACILSLDYVIVCTGNDDMNLQVATRLFTYAYRQRVGVKSKMGIYVCCTNKDNFLRMKDMEKHYNEISSDKCIRINIFGSPQEIYTYRLIVANSIIKEAMRFNKVYAEAAKRLEREIELDLDKKNQIEKEYVEICQRSDEEQWQADFNLQKEKWDKRFKKMSNLKQNISNSLHIDTKLSLVGLSRSDQENLTQLLQWNEYAKEHGDKVSYCNKQYAFTQLAICEHLRWEASMKMLGYTYTDGEKNYRSRVHPCMKPFAQLDAGTQMYDYLVVDTSFAIACSSQDT